MARGKRIYILKIKVNKLLPFFSSRCFRKEIENMFSVFLSIYRNTHESLGELKKPWKHSPTARLPTAFLVLPNFHSCFYCTNRFHVAVRLFSNRSQMTSKCGKSKKVAHEVIAECVTDVLTTCWRHLWSITEQTHGNMESICAIETHTVCVLLLLQAMKLHTFYRAVHAYTHLSFCNNGSAKAALHLQRVACNKW